MKKLIALLIAATFAMPALALPKKPAPKVVKHHQKFEGEKVPTAPAKPANPAPKKK
jgi:hypothetical protein